MYVRRIDLLSERICKVQVCSMSPAQRGLGLDSCPQLRLLHATTGMGLRWPLGLTAVVVLLTVVLAISARTMPPWIGRQAGTSVAPSTKFEQLGGAISTFPAAVPDNVRPTSRWQGEYLQPKL